MSNYVERYDCDGAGPHARGLIRKLPLGGGANLLVCAFCFEKEIAYRKDRNMHLAVENRFELPDFAELEAVTA